MTATPELTPAAGEGDPSAAGDGEVESDSGPAPSPSSTIRDRVITCWTGTCPNCGGALTHVAEGVPSDHDARAVVRCSSCGRTFLVQITVTDASDELGRSRPRHPDGCGCAACERARQTTCLRGHDLSGDVRVDSTGKRICRICERQRRAA